MDGAVEAELDGAPESEPVTAAELAGAVATVEAGEGVRRRRRRRGGRGRAGAAEGGPTTGQDDGDEIADTA